MTQGWRNVLSTCPDGMPNSWEVDIPNGLYVATVAQLPHTGYNFANSGCSFENVQVDSSPNVAYNTGGTWRANGRMTVTFTVEITDGRFTMGVHEGRQRCDNVNWIKLDRIAAAPLPAPWLPSPEHEWMQVELAEETPIGLVQLMLPGLPTVSSASFPVFDGASEPNCRQRWLYEPASCHRVLRLGTLDGEHPDLMAYPDFPGLSATFLGHIFDMLDSNADGTLSLREMAASDNLQHAQDLLFGGNVTHRLDDTVVDPDVSWDKMRELWVIADPAITSDIGRRIGAYDQPGNYAMIRSEFITGALSRPAAQEWNSGCPRTGGYSCRRQRQVFPQLAGRFSDDGDHGFKVIVSDTPCTSVNGCLEPGADANVTICGGGTQLVVPMTKYTDVGTSRSLLQQQNSQPTVDCGGATGRFVQVVLPGTGRILALDEIRVHGAKLPSVAGIPSRTESRKPMACYGLMARDPPTADDPNLLADAKNPPKQVVSDNPMDPVFYSTCLVRAVVTEWLPLLLSGSESSTGSSVEWSFNNHSHCLACDCVDANLDPAGGVEYNMSEMPTVHWWLQPADVCDCCAEPCPPTRAPTELPTHSAPTGEPTSMPSGRPTILPTDGPTLAPSFTPTSAPTTLQMTSAGSGGETGGKDTTTVAIVIVAVLLAAIVLGVGIVRARQHKSAGDRGRPSPGDAHNNPTFEGAESFGFTLMQ
jgi:hypothetical protein